MKLESGYYWVYAKYRKEKTPVIAYIDSDGDVCTHQDGGYYKEDDFEFLDLPRIKTPDEL
ncbi:hypothetical protein UFOVP129_2 [uncultured Caudovirales phage]|uniref:Uncharacterized protein n=1 Tax=uncultured Caudovirales phage TaxID=2100421 RepID=A0A6J5LAR7_9CAUD|nr:hypothetical protein UFOVP129_2 [uncultured Caudovirales phage]